MMKFQDIMNFFFISGNIVFLKNTQDSFEIFIKYQDRNLLDFE